MKKVEEGSPKLERKKVSPAILERVKLFNAAFNFDYDGSEETEEEYLAFLARMDKIIGMPNRKTNVKEAFPIASQTSLEYDDGDIIEVVLLKAVMHCDQKKFSTIVLSSEIDPVVKTHVLGMSIQVACGFRDIEIVRFLEKNGVSIAKLHVISNDGALEEFTSIVFALNHFYAYKYFDQELVDFLLKKGADFNDKHDGVTAYFSVISSVPEEFSIKMLESITDINEVQHERRIYSFDTCPDVVRIEDSSYLTRAIVSGRFKLAKAMIECSAKIEEDQIIIWLESAIRSYNNFEFVQYLFEEEYITSLKGLENSDSILVQTARCENYKMFRFFIDKGARVEAKCSGFKYITTFGVPDYEAMYAPTIFAQLIIKVSEECLLKILQMVDLDVNAILYSKDALSAKEEVGKDSYLHRAIRRGKYVLTEKLIELGADVNFKSEVLGRDVWSYARHEYEIAKIIVASGKLDLTGRPEHEVKKYNQIKAKMLFEEKVLADVEAVNSAHDGINSKTIRHCNKITL